MLKMGKEKLKIFLVVTIIRNRSERIANKRRGKRNGKKRWNDGNEMILWNFFSYFWVVCVVSDHFESSWSHIFILVLSEHGKQVVEKRNTEKIFGKFIGNKMGKWENDVDGKLGVNVFFCERKNDVKASISQKKVLIFFDF